MNDLQQHIREEQQRGTRRTPPPKRERLVIAHPNKARMEVAERIIAPTSGKVVIRLRKA